MANPQIPNPTWEQYFAAQDAHLILAFKPTEIVKKAKEFKLTNPIVGKIGKVSYYDIYTATPLHGKNDAKAIAHALELLKTRLGKTAGYNWLEVKEKGAAHPIFLPGSGCFGFIEGHLILANRHHMEIMYRLMNDKGWTWDQLINAKQVWGWYARGGSNSVRFSSDAGVMTSEKVKKECLKAFEEYFGHSFTMGAGYGGKTKKTYGGNMEAKYGKVGEWGGYKAELDNTIISPLPDPPADEPKKASLDMVPDSVLKQILA